MISNRLKNPTELVIDCSNGPQVISSEQISPIQEEQFNTIGKFIYLDSLRGIACLCVVFHHSCNLILKVIDLAFSETFSDSYKIDFHDNPFTFFAAFNGRLLVIVFFVLSGRVLVSSYIHKPNNNILVSSAIKRPFRLGLPIIGCMASNYFIATFSNLLFPNYTEYTGIIKLGPWGEKYLDHNMEAPYYAPYQVYQMFMYYSRKSPAYLPDYQAGVLW